MLHSDFLELIWHKLSIFNYNTLKLRINLVPTSDDYSMYTLIIFIDYKSGENHNIVENFLSI